MYQGKRKNKKWTIQEKNEIVLLYLDGHMGWTEILRTFSIPGNRMLQRWIEQYRKNGTCVDNRGKCTKLQNPNKGRQKKTKTNYQNMTKEELIKELELRDELKNFLVYLNQQIKDTQLLMSLNINFQLLNFANCCRVLKAVTMLG